MLPMAVTALTVLVAQVEHGPKFWNHLLALPVRRASIFVAKVVVVVALTGIMSAALFLLLPALLPPEGGGRACAPKGALPGGGRGEMLAGSDWISPSLALPLRGRGPEATDFWKSRSQAGAWERDVLATPC